MALLREEEEEEEDAAAAEAAAEEARNSTAAVMGGLLLCAGLGGKEFSNSGRFSQSVGEGAERPQGGESPRRRDCYR
jgi:hypothetical protein